MSFVQRLFEKYLRSRDHYNGTYAGLYVSDICSEDIYRWCKDRNIPNLADPNQYHATVLMSTVGAPGVAKHKFDLPVFAVIDGWEILGMETKCLCLKLRENDLTKLNQELRAAYGANHKFSEFKPHITVSYDFTGEVPATFPNMVVRFDKAKVEPLKGD